MREPQIGLKDGAQTPALVPPTPHTPNSRPGHLIPDGSTGTAGQLQMGMWAVRGIVQYHEDSVAHLKMGFHDVPEMLPIKQLRNNDIAGSAKVGNCRACL